MSVITAQSVREFILTKFESTLRDHGMNVDQVPEDFDLFAEGIVDSMGVLNMITDVETEFGITLDMEKLDAEQLTILGAFSKYVAENSQSAAAQTNGSSANGHSLNLETVQTDMRDFIRQNYSITTDDREFTDDVHLYSAGYIDQMGVGILKNFIESKFSIQVTPSDLATRSLNTVREISEFVVKRRTGVI